QHGWQTAAIAGAANLDTVFNLDQGFQMYDDYLGHKVNPTVAATDHMKRWERSAAEVNRIAFNYLDHKKPGKFFLMIHYYDPHKPYQPPAPFDTMYDKGTDKKTTANAMYDGEVTYLDQQMGLLFDKLKSMKLLDNTLVIITADHGEGLY